MNGETHHKVNLVVVQPFLYYLLVRTTKALSCGRSTGAIHTPPAADTPPAATPAAHCRPARPARQILFHKFSLQNIAW